MKHLLFLVFFTYSFLEGRSQTEFTLGFADSIHSNVLHEQRQLLVFTPYSGKKIKLETKNIYPVLYVLDGESQFRSVAAIVERLIGNGVCPPMIVVGILNTNRVRDLTPTASVGNSNGLVGSGGGEQFILFLEKELIPYIDSLYPTAPYKLLMGHSLGGLMVMQTFVHHKHLFNAYISIDAAIWWDNHRILGESKLALKQGNYHNKTLFLTIANRMEKGVDTTAVQLDTTDNTELIRYNLDLIHYIKQHQENKLRFSHAYYEKENHGTVSFISAYDALRFIFDFYPLPIYANYSTENPNLVSLIINHYRNISNHLGYEVMPHAGLINSLGYRAMNTKQFEMAKKLFEMNIVNYPNDANLKDSFGDYYNAIGDKKNAIAWYQKALSVTEISETRGKLNALQQKKN